jgi:hypothetical protein
MNKSNSRFQGLGNHDLTVLLEMDCLTISITVSFLVFHQGRRIPLSLALLCKVSIFTPEQQM